MASSARTPHFSIARWPRDGKIHAPRALDALEACPKKLTSYLMLYGDGNNHLYGGAKKHRYHGVMPPALPLRDKVPGDPSRGRGYSPRMEHAIDYKSVLDCGIHQDWTPDS